MTASQTLRIEEKRLLAAMSTESAQRDKVCVVSVAHRTRFCDRAPIGVGTIVTREESSRSVQRNRLRFPSDDMRRLSSNGRSFDLLARIWRTRSAFSISTFFQPSLLPCANLTTSSTEMVIIERLLPQTLPSVICCKSSWQTGKAILSKFFAQPASTIARTNVCKNVRDAPTSGRRDGKKGFWTDSKLYSLEAQ